jgi:hypothetical protein
LGDPDYFFVKFIRIQFAKSLLDGILKAAKENSVLN